MAAHYDADSATEIRVFDSQSISDLLAFVQKEAANGVDLFIGPLEKDKVALLAEARLSVPVLALNRLPLPSNAPINGNLFQFGLAPEDEAIQIARRAQKDQHRRVLLLHPAMIGGIVQSMPINPRPRVFNTRTIIARYDDDVTYAQFVRQILEVDESQARSDELRRMIGRGFEFTPRRRQDLSDDCALSNGDDVARQLSPALAFYYADDLPVFATSQVNDVNATRINNLDLNGVQFLDIPWKLLPKDDLGDRIVGAWPAASGPSARYLRWEWIATTCYHDSSNCENFLIRFYGTTGTIRIEEQILRRDLTWATMENGSVQVAGLSADD